jgi:shikimate dehydrogenase
MITGQATIYAILGDPIAHVRTPMVFNALFEQQQRDAVLIPLRVPAGGLDAALDGLRAMDNVGGFVVTGPHKTTAARRCDALEDAARLAGAVNTIRREPDSRLVGTLFDGLGFVAGLRAQGHEPRGKRVYLAGAGGAGTALAFALADAGAAHLTIHNRDRAKAQDLARRVAAAYPSVTTEVGTSDPIDHDMAVNATALGLEPTDPLPFDALRVTPDMLIAEVIMKPEITALLRAAQARGCATHQGKHMLDNQVGLMAAFWGLAPR